MKIITNKYEKVTKIVQNTEVIETIVPSDILKKALAIEEIMKKDVGTTSTIYFKITIDMSEKESPIQLFCNYQHLYSGAKSGWVDVEIANKDTLASLGINRENIDRIFKVLGR